jgi:hypothetical protein
MSTNDDNQHYWMRAYEVEEADATRTAISRDELLLMTFNCHPWFLLRLLCNQPNNMRNVLPMGLRESINNVVFATTGVVPAKQCRFKEPMWRGSSCNSGDDN